MEINDFSKKSIGALDFSKKEYENNEFPKESLGINDFSKKSLGTIDFSKKSHENNEFPTKIVGGPMIFQEIIWNN